MPSREESLEQQVQAIFERYDPYVISLSEPYQHNYTLEGTELNEPAGGLTAALDPVLRNYGGTWIAAGTGDADWKFVDEERGEAVPPEDPSYRLRRVKLSQQMVWNYYYGFNHRTFWPLLHTVFHRPDFNSEYWKGFRRANSLFAQATLEEIGEDRSLLWFQDFQLSLAPREVREELGSSGVEMVHFWHVPWPPSEVFYRCPWAEQILDGLLANDLIGFHTPDHARNFLRTAQSLEKSRVDYDQNKVEYKGAVTSVTSAPISVDFEAIDRLARSEEVEKKIEELHNYHYLKGNSVGLGIDRLDYAKGIPERLEAIDSMLSNYPEHKTNFVFVQASAPILSRVADYRNLTHRVESLVDEINQKHEEDGWRPIWFLEKKVQLPTLRALQRIADLYLVTSLHDGMNLVAKENVAADVDRDGHLLLSKFAGAARELKEATYVNPYDTEGLREAIHEGLRLERAEREERMSKLRERVKKHDIDHWLAQFLGQVIESL